MLGQKAFTYQLSSDKLSQIYKSTHQSKRQPLSTTVIHTHTHTFTLHTATYTQLRTYRSHTTHIPSTHIATFNIHGYILMHRTHSHTLISYTVTHTHTKTHTTYTKIQTDTQATLLPTTQLNTQCPAQGLLM